MVAGRLGRAAATECLGRRYEVAGSVQADALAHRVGVDLRRLGRADGQEPVAALVQRPPEVRREQRPNDQGDEQSDSNEDRQEAEAEQCLRGILNAAEQGQS